MSDTEAGHLYVEVYEKLFEYMGTGDLSSVEITCPLWTKSSREVLVSTQSSHPSNKAETFE